VNVTGDIITASDTVWFSVKEKRWKVGYFGKFSWTGKEEIWDSDNCTIGLARTLKDQLLVVVRSDYTRHSSFMERAVRIRYMIGFSLAGRPSEPKTESYVARNNSPARREGPKNRWVLQLDENHWVWEWAKEGADITDSATFKIYREIVNEIDRPSKKTDNIFQVQVDMQEDGVIPVVYQPAVDALKNFVREIHCAKGPARPDGSYEVEVSILFNNERLRKHGFLNSIYSLFRRLVYGRLMDLESFVTVINKDSAKNRFTFAGIYSGDNGMNEDSIHGDRTPQAAPEHSIKYYFVNDKHPVVFVNTANHAMAEHDANNKIWKFEYVPWLKDSPIKLGTKARREIEESLKSPLKFW
jgi:hypothetical protein